MQRTRSRSLLLSLLALLALPALAPPALAQPWRGTAAVEVEITQKGKPVAGAEVVLVFLDADPRTGPAGISTDGGGQAVAGGLAEGRWRVEVRYGGKSPYSAVVQVTAGSRAEVVAGPVRDAAAPPLNVRFVKPRGLVPRVAAAEPPSTPPAPVASPRPPAAPAPQPKPSAPVAETPAPTQPAPPRPTSPPAAPPELATPPASPPVAAAPVPAPPSRPPAAPPAATQPASPAATPLAAKPEAAAPQPAASASAAGLRSAADGTCRECKPGELALSVQAAAAPASGTAACNALEDAGRSFAELAATAPGAAASHRGSPFDPRSGGLAEVYGAAAGERALPALAPYLRPDGPCQLLAIALPAGARYSGYAYEASDSTSSGACVADTECEIGKAHWSGHPVLDRTKLGTFVYAAFSNQSSERERRARLTVYFAPAPAR